MNQTPKETRKHRARFRGEDQRLPASRGGGITKGCRRRVGRLGVALCVAFASIGITSTSPAYAIYERGGLGCAEGYAVVAGIGSYGGDWVRVTFEFHDGTATGSWQAVEATGGPFGNGWLQMTTLGGETWTATGRGWWRAWVEVWDEVVGYGLEQSHYAHGPVAGYLCSSM